MSLCNNMLMISKLTLILINFFFVYIMHYTSLKVLARQKISEFNLFIICLYLKTVYKR